MDAVSELLLDSETLVFRIRALVTDVQAITVVRVRIAVDELSVLRFRDQLQRGHRLELQRSLRRVGWLRREPCRRQEVSRFPCLVPAHGGTAAQGECHRDYCHELRSSRDRHL